MYILENNSSKLATKTYQLPDMGFLTGFIITSWIPNSVFKKVVGYLSNKLTTLHK